MFQATIPCPCCRCPECNPACDPVPCCPPSGDPTFAALAGRHKACYQAWQNPATPPPRVLNFQLLCPCCAGQAQGPFCPGCPVLHGQIWPGGGPGGGSQLANLGSCGGTTNAPGAGLGGMVSYADDCLAQWQNSSNLGCFLGRCDGAGIWDTVSVNDLDSSNAFGLPASSYQVISCVPFAAVWKSYLFVPGYCTATWNGTAFDYAATYCGTPVPLAPGSSTCSGVLVPFTLNIYE